MSSIVTTRNILLTLAVVGIGVNPLSAQDRSTGQEDSGMVEHAEIGTLEAIDNNRVVIGRPPHDLPFADKNYWSFTTDFPTEIRGLGGDPMMDVGEILPDARGRVVLVTFTAGAEQPHATQLYFPGAREIRATHGTITRIDRAESYLFLETPGGSEERFSIGIGPGVTIDSDRGLLNPSDLQPGQEVTVYHSRRGEPIFGPEAARRGEPRFGPEEAQGYLIFVYGDPETRS